MCNIVNIWRNILYDNTVLDRYGRFESNSGIESLPMTLYILYSMLEGERGDLSL